jgi:hypothetical protein
MVTLQRIKPMRVLQKMRTAFSCGSILIRLANRQEFPVNVSL